MLAHNFLDTIMADKAIEVAELKSQRSLPQLKKSLNSRQTPIRNFKQAIDKKSGLGLIAEIKKASPSAGIISPDFDHLKIAQEYQNSGLVDAISVLTEQKYFQGSLEFIAAIKQQVTLPILRKDFIFDEYQIYESYLAESDALLLIAAVLEKSELQYLLQLSHELGLECLVETHNQLEVERALAAGAKIIGVNARNLATFDIDKDLFARLAQNIPPSVVKVAESGLETNQEVQRVAEAGANAVLVGTSIMTAHNKAQKIAELMQTRKS